MKKILSLILSLILVCLSLTGCFLPRLLASAGLLGVGMLSMGTYYYGSVSEYGIWEKDNLEAEFLPESVNEYIVNTFSYILYNYFDTCHEIFLDISVTAEQFDTLINYAKSYSPDFKEQPAWYCEGYIEIVYTDRYNRGSIEDQADGLEQVGWADVDKVIYNPETLNIIYVSFHANDTNVHDVENVAYFNRFNIIPEEYVKHLPDDTE